MAINEAMRKKNKKGRPLTRKAGSVEGGSEKATKDGDGKTTETGKSLSNSSSSTAGMSVSERRKERNERIGECTWLTRGMM